MSRTIPRAYVTAAWSSNPVEAADQARKYCRELAKADISMAKHYKVIPTTLEGVLSCTE